MYLDDLRLKIRALIEDFGKCRPEIFPYEGSNKFPLCAGNVTEIVKVTVNDVEIDSSDYTFDTNTNTIEILTALNETDIIRIDYKCQKYTDAELDEYIRGALVWLSIFSYCSDEDFELENDDIFPTPSNKEYDLIALVTSILIKPDYNSYKLPNLTVSYPRTMSKEDRIRKLVLEFRKGLGTVAVLEWE